VWAIEHWAIQTHSVHEKSVLKVNIKFIKNIPTIIFKKDEGTACKIQIWVVLIRFWEK